MIFIMFIGDSHKIRNHVFYSRYYCQTDTAVMMVSGEHFNLDFPLKQKSYLNIYLTKQAELSSRQKKLSMDITK